MSSSRCLRLALRTRPPHRIVTSSKVSPFTTSSRCQASGPAKDFADTISPNKSLPLDSIPAESRPSSEASDARNPALHGYPAPDGTMTRSTVTPDSMRSMDAPSETNENKVPVGTNSATKSTLMDGTHNQNGRNTSADLTQTSRQASQPPSSRSPLPSSSATADLVEKMGDTLRGVPSTRRTLPNSSSAARPSSMRDNSQPSGSVLRAAGLGNTRESVVFNRRVEGQQPRVWQPGDVYSPHDLSPAEALKNSRAGSTSTRNQQARRPPTRSTGGIDVFDAMCIDPVKEYKNFAMMGEFVTEMGRIKGRRITGLRLVNQRKLAKAVRRAVGLGLVPSVHRHPELFDSRLEQMGRKAPREISRGS